MFPSLPFFLPMCFPGLPFFFPKCFPSLPFSPIFKPKFMPPGVWLINVAPSLLTPAQGQDTAVDVHLSSRTFHQPLTREHSKSF